MAAVTLSNLPRVRVDTTLPVVDKLTKAIYDDQKRTVRLLQPSDFVECSALLQDRTTSVGHFSPDIYRDDTPEGRKHFEQALNDPDSLHYGLFVIQSGDQSLLEGVGGVVVTTSSWPSYYYTIRKIEDDDTKEFHNNWEIFFHGVYRHWWELPRKEAKLEVFGFSVPKDPIGVLKPLECLCTTVKQGDYQNEKRIQRSDFAKCKTLPDGDVYWRFTRPISVSTTVPDLQNLRMSFQPFTTEKYGLILRLLNLSDTEALHRLRSEEQPMNDFGTGPDVNMEATQRHMNTVLQNESNNNRLELGIFLERNGEEGELIGCIGTDLWETDWPSIFFVLKGEHQRHKYGRDFIKAYTTFWWNLKRKEVEIPGIRATTIDYDVAPNFKAAVKATELLCAVVDKNNVASEGLLKAGGFENNGDFTDTETYWRLKKPDA
ncbi:uncharacterized protein JN550_005376 [Neoarthrinium moseri]|uniref:uncharacterized protein n=1 Tax=Neoarthrinium moseri TaxID=1658444 RepID=UPI001FDC1C92|nr:uncharacterized protein JN550_005376 [Neoarthrinium moseri]KAI1870448.1 hypothetical protein JN550_005376 [Neoarthrinium moseri]